jgi:hypothetical protein
MCRNRRNQRSGELGRKPQTGPTAPWTSCGVASGRRRASDRSSRVLWPLSCGSCWPCGRCGPRFSLSGYVICTQCLSLSEYRVCTWYLEERPDEARALRPPTGRAAPWTAYGVASGRRRVSDRSSLALWPLAAGYVEGVPHFCSLSGYLFCTGHLSLKGYRVCSHGRLRPCAMCGHALLPNWIQSLYPCKFPGRSPAGIAGDAPDMAQCISLHWLQNLYTACLLK